MPTIVTRRVTRLCYRGSTALWLVLACAPSASPDPCGGRCQEGWACLEADCVKVCVTSDDCPSTGMVCVGGYCRVDVPTCASDAECTTPGSCETTIGARCVNSECRYPPRACNEPPSGECIESDAKYRSYGYLGRCDAMLDTCVYPTFDTACIGCAATCLPRCAGVTCADAPSICGINGRCVPSAPATCAYDDVPDGAACSRPSNGGPGACVAGQCLAPTTQACASNGDCGADTCLGGGCRPRSQATLPCDTNDNEDCVSPSSCISRHCRLPNDATCTTNEQCANTCISGACKNRADGGATCDTADHDDCLTGLSCIGGVCRKPDGRPCGGNSECIHTCIAGMCAPIGATGTACDVADHADCTTGLCDSAVCLWPNDSPCAADDECSGTCLAAFCADPVAPGGICDTTGDCVTQLVTVTCGAGARCRMANGGACSANGQCEGSCRAGVCTSLSEIGGACDSEDDGDCRSGLTCAGTACKIPLNDPCTQDSECEFAQCECTDATCTSGTQVCAGSDCGCTLWNGSSCSGNIDTGTVDPVDCNGTNACHTGKCRAVSAGTCACATSSACTICNCARPALSSNGCGLNWTASCTGACTPSGLCSFFSTCACSCASTCTCQAL